MPGRIIYLDNGRAGAYCACSRFVFFLLPIPIISLFFLPFSVMAVWIISNVKLFSINF